MAALNYERITVPGVDAMDAWKELKGSGRGWPVIVGSDDDLDRIADQYSMGDPLASGVIVPDQHSRSPQDILSAAANLTFPIDLNKWSEAFPADELNAPVGLWPPEAGGGSLGPSVVFDHLRNTFHPQVHILLIPTERGWEVPAFLRWGDWNACPPPEYHVAALRSWHQHFAAELVGISGDTIDVRIGCRPDTRAEAMDLARQHYQYCPDTIDQGVETISTLAADLINSDWWFFWWD